MAWCATLNRRVNKNERRKPCGSSEMVCDRSIDLPMKQECFCLKGFVNLMVCGLRHDWLMGVCECLIVCAIAHIPYIYIYWIGDIVLNRCWLPIGQYFCVVTSIGTEQSNSWSTVWLMVPVQRSWLCPFVSTKVWYFVCVCVCVVIVVDTTVCVARRQPKAINQHTGICKKSSILHSITMDAFHALNFIFWTGHVRTDLVPYIKHRDSEWSSPRQGDKLPYEVSFATSTPDRSIRGLIR